MRITMTNKPIISAQLKVSKKELENSELFMEDFLGMLLSACESLCERGGINDFEKRKAFTKDILKTASVMAEEVYDEMIKDQTEPQGEMVDGSELVDFMENIYHEYIERCEKSLGRTEEEILGLFEEEKDYSLEVKDDASDYGFCLTDGTETIIPLGQVAKDSSEKEKEIASKKAFIFASRLLYRALGDDCSSGILKKYTNLEYMYDLIKSMENDKK